MFRQNAGSEPGQNWIRPNMSVPPEAPWTDPTDADVERAADRILAADTEVPAAELRTISDCVIRVSWISESSRIGEPTLAFLFDYWRGLDAAQPDGVPFAAEVDGIDLMPALGNIMLLDVERDGLDARYRLYGTKVASKAGRDWTGWLVSEMGRTTQTPATLLYRAGYRAVFQRRAALFTEHNSPPWVAAEAWRRLILPLCDETGNCIRFLVGNMAVGHRLMSEAQIEAQQRHLRKH